MPKSKHYLNSKGEQIDFTVDVYTRPNLRCPTGEMFAYMGKNILEIMFDKLTIDKSIKSFHLEYPERWANILELRAIPIRMISCFPNLERVTIKTHSVYIIQCVVAEHIRICDDASKYEEVGYGDITKRYCDLPKEFQGLWRADANGICELKAPKLSSADK